MREGHSFLDYHGGEEEFAKIQTAVLQTQKRHIVFTGSRSLDKAGLLRMLQDNALRGYISLGNGTPPIILELAVVNTLDRESLVATKNNLDVAKVLADHANQRVILYFDEAKIVNKTPETLRNLLLAMGEDSFQQFSGSLGIS